MMIFGGHRLWHGFATDNSEANAWSSFEEYPEGGFLQDLWVYTKIQLKEDEQVRRRYAKKGRGRNGKFPWCSKATSFVFEKGGEG